MASRAMKMTSIQKLPKKNHCVFYVREHKFLCIPNSKIEKSANMKNQNIVHLGAFVEMEKEFTYPVHSG